jgi:D-cysteine desulfhydrase
VRRLEIGDARTELWVKDDGAFAPHGGNKARKLEWLLAEAQRRSSQTVITGGAIGTNHGLAVARYAAGLGMRTVLVLVPQPTDDHVRAQLDAIRETGAELRFAGGLVSGIATGLREVVARQAASERPFLMPPGGSTPRGCIGYVCAGLELGRQVREGGLPEPQRLIVAAGTGGTAAGLLLGLRLCGLRTRVTPILVNDVTPVTPRGIASLAGRTAQLMRRGGARVPALALAARDVDLRRDWLGGGYGHPTAVGAAAIERFAAEGVGLEPVYTAKAAAAALALREEPGAGPVLYWHTYGGAPPEVAAVLR